MPNENGSVYGLTILSPIIDDEKATPSHDLQIRDYLAQLSTREDSPFALAPGTHLARLVVMDDVIYVGMPRAKSISSRSTWSLNRTATATSNAISPALPSMFRSTSTPSGVHCVGYPGAANRQAFIDYMKACQLDTTFYFAAVNDKSVPETLRALQTQTAVADFIASHQGTDPATLQREFLRVRAQPQIAARSAGPAPWDRIARSRRVVAMSKLNETDIQGFVLRGYNLPVRPLSVPAL